MICYKTEIEAQRAVTEINRYKRLRIESNKNSKLEKYETVKSNKIKEEQTGKKKTGNGLFLKIMRSTRSYHRNKMV